MLEKKIISTDDDYLYVSSLFRPENTEFFQTKEISKNRLKEISVQPGRSDFILFSDCKKIGWFHITVSANPCDGVVFGIIIDKPFRNKGFGHDAMRLIEDEAFKIGAKKISLKVSECNGSAIKVYEDAGFKQIERQILMEKEIG